MKFLLSLLFCFPTFAFSNEIVDVYLTKSNHCALTGMVDKDSVDHTIACLSRRNYKTPKDKFYLVVNSGGGYVHEGERLIRYLKDNPGIPTVTYWAASMALAIVEANPGERLIIKGGTIMQHRISTGIKFQFFDYDKFKQYVEESKIISDRFHNYNLSRTELDKDFYWSKIIKEWYMNTRESLLYNFMDAKVTAKCSQKLINSTKNKTVWSFFGPVPVKESLCPIQRRM